MLGRILLDNDYFLVTAGLLGSIKATLKSRGLTLKATREERTKLLDVLDELKRRGYSVEPNSKEFEEILGGFSEALFGRGGYRWQAYFLVTTCENIVSDVIWESDNSNTDVEKVDSSVTSPLDWNNVSDFFEVDWRPAVITRSEEVVEGWFSPEAGKPFRPLALGDILKNGSAMSKADFQEAFPGEIAGADTITSNIDLPNIVPFDWNDISSFFDWEGRPAVTVTPSDGLLEGWFIQTSSEPGVWGRASPLEILDSGRELSKSDFQDTFTDFNITIN
jgi:hypothetical protein